MLHSLDALAGKLSPGSNKSSSHSGVQASQLDGNANRVHPYLKQSSANSKSLATLNSITSATNLRRVLGTLLRLQSIQPAGYSQTTCHKSRSTNKVLVDLTISSR